MSIYQNYCREQFDEAGRLIDIQFHYPENFNFGYDVVDVIAKQTPQKRAVVWCNTEGEEHIFTFEAQVTYINVGRHIHTCKVTYVNRAVGIWQGRCHKSSFEFLFHRRFIFCFLFYLRFWCILQSNLQK